MTKTKKPEAVTQDQLREIHTVLTRVTLKRIREAAEPPKIIDGVLTNPPLKASELAVMVKFLKDNGIVAEDSYDSERARRAAEGEESFPFPADDSDR